MQGLKLKIIQVWILNELYITKLWEDVITLDFSSEGLHFKFSLSTNFQRFDVNICNFQIKKHQINLEYRNKQKRVNHFTIPAHPKCNGYGDVLGKPKDYMIFKKAYWSGSKCIRKVFCNWRIFLFFYIFSKTRENFNLSVIGVAKFISILYLRKIRPSIEFKLNQCISSFCLGKTAIITWLCVTSSSNFSLTRPISLLQFKPLTLLLLKWNSSVIQNRGSLHNSQTMYILRLEIPSTGNFRV